MWHLQYTGLIVLKVKTKIIAEFFFAFINKVLFCINAKLHYTDAIFLLTLLFAKNTEEPLHAKLNVVGREQAVLFTC